MNTLFWEDRMPKFNRSFDVAELAQWDAANPGNAVRALFDQWALPGQPSTASRMLRVGIRHRYLNLYAMGQSVANLSIGRNGPVVEVHEAYVSGRLSTEKNDTGSPLEQRYIPFGAEMLAKPMTAELIPHWVATAESHASAEKRFVDELIAANSGVIDLEMGLPASDLPGSERVAPRMDLVVAQIASDGAPSIAFWEAKCANNKELRASGDSDPKVLGQVGKYVRWMAEDDRIAQVQQAYRNAAGTLLDLDRLFRKSDGATPACVGIWRALAETDVPMVIVQPGIVIGNYWPEGSTEGIASGRMRQCAASFARNGHGEKLARHGIAVHEVGPDHKKPALPPLSTAKVSA